MKELEKKQIEEMIDKAINMMDYSYVPYSHFHVGAALLAKKALLRETGGHNEDPFYAELERELLGRINALGIGPQGFGGRTTCLGLAIEQMPTHVAGLPAAVNVSCHVTRRASAEL